MCVYIYTRIYIYIHTHTHTHIHKFNVFDTCCLTHCYFAVCDRLVVRYFGKMNFRNCKKCILDHLIMLFNSSLNETIIYVKCHNWRCVVLLVTYFWIRHYLLVIMYIWFFWNMTTCSLSGIHRHFGGAYFLYFLLRKCRPFAPPDNHCKPLRTTLCRNPQHL
jgi:hypothetical protein